MEAKIAKAAMEIVASHLPTRENEVERFVACVTRPEMKGRSGEWRIGDGLARLFVSSSGFYVEADTAIGTGIVEAVNGKLRGIVSKPACATEKQMVYA